MFVNTVALMQEFRTIKDCMLHILTNFVFVYRLPTVVGTVVGLACDAHFWVQLLLQQRLCSIFSPMVCLVGISFDRSSLWSWLYQQCALVHQLHTGFSCTESCVLCYAICWHMFSSHLWLLLSMHLPFRLLLCQSLHLLHASYSYSSFWFKMT